MILIVFDITSKGKPIEQKLVAIDANEKDKVLDKIKSTNRAFKEKYNSTDPLRCVDYILRVIYEDFGYTAPMLPSEFKDIITIEVTE